MSVQPGQIWVKGVITHRALIISVPYATELGKAVHAITIAPRRRHAEEPQRQLLTAPMTLHLGADGQPVGYRLEVTVPVLRCVSVTVAREASYMLRPQGLPDALASGSLLIPGADLVSTDLVVVHALALRYEWSPRYRVDALLAEISRMERRERRARAVPSVASD